MEATKVLFYLVPDMASSVAAEPSVCSGAISTAECTVPACMFAPERGCVEDPCGAESFDDGDAPTGESADHLDVSSKVGLTALPPLSCSDEWIRVRSRSVFLSREVSL